MSEEGSSLDKQIKTYSNRTHYYSGVLLKSKTGASIGYTDDKYRGETSAAAHLAQVEKNVLLIEKLPESDDYWVVGIVDGLVQPMTDTVINLDDLQSHLNEVYENVSDAAARLNLHLRICCNDESITIDNVELVGFEQLLADVPARNSAKIRALRASKFDFKRVAVYGLAAVLVYVIYDSFISEAPLPPPVAQQPALQEPKENIEAIFTQDMNNLLRFYSASYQLELAERVRKATPRYIKGWVLSELRIDTAENYSLIYIRRRHTTINHLLEKLDGYQSYIATDTGEKVTFTYQIDRKENPSPDYTMEQYRTAEKKYSDMLSDLQMQNNCEFTIKAFKTVADSGSSLQLASLDRFPPGQKPMSSFTWDISAKGIWMLPSIQKLVSNYRYTVISTLIVNFDKDEIMMTGLLFDGV